MLKAVRDFAMANLKKQDICLTPLRHIREMNWATIKYRKQLSVKTLLLFTDEQQQWQYLDTDILL
jgi:hypothetical protein